MQTASASPVSQPNTYRFVVKDLTKAQNFHLVGPSVNKRTKVPAKVTTSWTVYLAAGHLHVSFRQARDDERAPSPSDRARRLRKTDSAIAP